MIAQGSGDEEEVMLDLVANCAVAKSAAANDETKSSKKVIVTKLKSVTERMRTQNKECLSRRYGIMGEMYAGLSTAYILQKFRMRVLHEYDGRIK
jgi:hypothetical protein